VKIVFDNQIFCRQKYGGISRYFIELAESISQLSSEDRSYIVAPLHFNKPLSKSGATVDPSIYIPWSTQAMGWNALIGNLSTRIAVRKIAKIQPDLIHETFFSLTDKWNISAPKVLTVYDLIREKQNTSHKNLQRIKKEASINRAEKIICISEKTKRDLLDIYELDESKVTVIHLGVAQDFACKSIQSRRKKQILFVGQRDGYKNFQTLVSAFASSKLLVDGYILKTFGGSPFSREEKILFDNLGLTQHQIVHEEGDDTELKHAYGESMALIIPSLDEGFGLPILEALSDGLAVICSNIEVFYEIAGDKVEYFNPQDSDDLKTKLNDLLHRDYYEESLIYKRKSHAKIFTWEKCAFKTLEVYKTLVDD
jgi:glycosyltransferase involved in cell wall biosynthesis